MLFIIKGVPGGRIERNIIPTLSSNDHYLVQENGWRTEIIWCYYIQHIIKSFYEGKKFLLIDDILKLLMIFFVHYHPIQCLMYNL